MSVVYFSVTKSKDFKKSHSTKKYPGFDYWGLLARREIRATQRSQRNNNFRRGWKKTDTYIKGKGRRWIWVD